MKSPAMKTYADMNWARSVLASAQNAITSDVTPATLDIAAVTGVQGGLAVLGWILGVKGDQARVQAMLEGLVAALKESGYEIEPEPQRRNQ